LDQQREPRLGFDALPQSPEGLGFRFLELFQRLA
jgi:hypothetical protein